MKNYFKFNQFKSWVFSSTFIVFAASAFFAGTLHAAVPPVTQKSVVVTTLIPAPVGAFDIVNTGKASFTGAYVPGDSCDPNDFITIGGVGYGCALGVFQPIHGVWTQVGDHIYPQDLGNPNLKVGIGSGFELIPPQAKLHLRDDAGIISEGTLGAGDHVPALSAGTRMIWNPRKAAFRAGQVDGNQWDDSNVGYHSVAFGESTQASGAGSVTFGSHNTTDSTYSVIGGGESNIITAAGGAGQHQVIAGGESNTNEGEWTSIGGGQLNWINSIVDAYDDKYSTIAGGYRNWATGQNNTIGGGEDNWAAIQNSTVAGGVNNRSYCDTCTVTGGSANITASTSLGIHQHSYIGGGKSNLTMYNYVTIGGGEDNSIVGNHATIAGGKTNSIGDPTVAATGCVKGGGCTVVGDVNAWADETTISGGSLNNIERGAHKATIGGGTNNQIYYWADASVIAGGRDNTIGIDDITPSAIGDYSVIAGGRDNLVTGAYASISGGNDNQANGHQSIVAGGSDNEANGNYSFAGGLNTIVNGNRTFVWGASNSDVTVDQDNSFIIHSSNVGIGTLAPTQALHINNVMRLEPTATAAAPNCTEMGTLYVDSSRALCYCDGDAWERINSLGVCK